VNVRHKHSITSWDIKTCLILSKIDSLPSHFKRCNISKMGTKRHQLQGKAPIYKSQSQRPEMPRMEEWEWECWGGDSQPPPTTVGLGVGQSSTTETDFCILKSFMLFTRT